MEKLNHPSNLKMKKIKKYIREPRELKNLKYLLQLAPSLIPSIEIITDDYYVMEKCEVIEPKDFEPANFYRLYTSLLMPLHKFKRKSFTPGIYKYFAPYSLNFEIKEQYYIPYIMNELKKIVQDASLQLPELPDDAIFTNLVRYLKSTSRHFENWKPDSGYSLLHGDLHAGNIVKKDNNYLLIDFEYLRYGVAELEVANLVISSLIYYYMNMSLNINNLIIEYLQVCSELPQIDDTLFKFLFIFSLSLFYLSFYLRKKENELEGIRKIAKQMLPKQVDRGKTIATKPNSAVLRTLPFGSLNRRICGFATLRPNLPTANFTYLKNVVRHAVKNIEEVKKCLRKKLL